VANDDDEPTKVGPAPAQPQRSTEVGVAVGPGASAPPEVDVGQAERAGIGRDVGVPPGATGPGIGGVHATGAPSGPGSGQPQIVSPGGAPQTPPAPGEPTPPNQESVGKAVWSGVKDAGMPVVRFLDMIGGHLILAGKALSWIPRRPFRGKNYLEAAEYIGWGSLPIVLIVGAFTGMVLSIQAVYAFRQLGFESYSGAMTAKALSIELGPVLTSLMLAGRAGAGIATELGTMRISEQIDALESMAVNPIQYLVLPRLVAAMIVMPILTLLFFIVGMGGGYLVAVVLEGVSAGQWIAKIRDIVEFTDVLQGLIKSVFFGMLVTLIGCYQGYNATGGGRGVGIGTTRAVVLGSVSTLILDYFLTDILLNVFSTHK
jgi:phospholipid/cholesterol/gamma-HCH transport system permease protein